MTDRRALLALLRLELDRTLPQLSRTLGLAALAGVALVAFGAATLPRLVFLTTFLAVAGIGTLLQNVIRDKLEGGLEFLVSLPVDRRILALARLTACAALAVPAGACLTAVGVLALQRSGAPWPGALPVAAAFVLTASGVAAVAALVAGVSLRLKVAHLANLVAAGFLGGLGVLWLVSHVFRPSQKSLLELAAIPWLPPALVACVLGLIVAVGWSGYYLAWTGLERFRPGRDRVDW